MRYKKYVVCLKRKLYSLRINFRDELAPWHYFNVLVLLSLIWLNVTTRSGYACEVLGCFEWFCYPFREKRESYIHTCTTCDNSPPDVKLEPFIATNNVILSAKSTSPLCENFIIEPLKTPCKGSVPFMAIVSSAPANHAQRLAIRLTWGTTQPTYFFMGISQNDHLTQLKENLKESQQYDDLIVSSFVDSYDNLTLKTNSMFSWASERCAHANYVMKVDDDVFVNPWLLQTQLDNYTYNQFDLIGRKYHNASPIRDVYDKWYTPDYLYDGDLFPEYLGGPSYIIRGDLVPQLYRASFEVPLINLEDVYYTYLVAKKQLNLELTHSQHIITNKPPYKDLCFYWNCISIHEETPQDMIYLWDNFVLLAQADRC